MGLPAIAFFRYIRIAHCATGTRFHDNMSTFLERYEREVFKKLSFENANSKLLTTTAQRRDGKNAKKFQLRSRVKFEI